MKIPLSQRKSHIFGLKVLKVPFLLKLDLVISGDSESDRHIMEEKIQKPIWFNDKGMSDIYPHEVRINPKARFFY